MFAIAGSIAALVIFSLTATLMAQDAQESSPVPADSKPALAEEAKPLEEANPPAPLQEKAPRNGDIEKELYGRWASVLNSLDSKDYEAVKSNLAELEKRCYELGLNSCEELSASMVKRGKIQLDGKDVGGALMLFESAARISPNYPPPRYALGWGYLAQNKTKVLKAADAFVEGFSRSAGDFWWSFFYTGNKATSLLFTLAALFSLFGLFMALRYSPLLAHDIAEFLKKQETEGVMKYVLLPGAFLLVLFVLGYWWAATFVFISLWAYFKKREKTLAVLFFILLIFMPDIMTYFASFIKAGGNRLLWVMDGVNKGRVVEGSREFLVRTLEEEPENKEALMALAQISKRDGNYKEATEYYGRLIELNPGSAIYHNNLGNILFISNDADGAIKEYNTAIQLDPGKVLPYFNLSQVYGEKLLFTERESVDLKARELDPALVSELRLKTADTPSRMVFDEPMPVGSFWKLAFRNTSAREQGLADSLWSTTVKVLPLQGTRVAGAAFIILALALSAFRKKGGVYSHFCQKCGKVSCRKCQKPFYSKELCAQCHQIFVKLEGVEAKDRVRKMLEVRERQQKEGVLYRVAALVLPGSGHFLTGRPFRGFLFMGIFVFFIKDIFFGRFLYVPYDFNLPFIRPDAVLGFALLLLFYVLTQFDTHRITK